MNEIVAGYGYNGKPNTKHRLLAWHGDLLVALRWFCISRDGSLYCGPYVRKADGVASGTFRTGDFVAYEDFSFKSPGNNPSKISFHTSGRVHYGGELALRGGFEGQSGTDKICDIFLPFPKPKDLKNKNEIRKTDIVSGFMIDEAAPCACHVLYSVGTQHKLTEFSDIEWKTIIVYKDLERVGDVVLEIAISQKRGNAWPPYSIVIWKAEPSNTSTD